MITNCAGPTWSGSRGASLETWRECCSLRFSSNDISEWGRNAETVAAFRPHSEMSFEEKRREQHSRQVSSDAPREPLHVGPAQFVIIKLVVLFAVVIPVSALVATVFHRLFRV